MVYLLPLQANISVLVHVTEECLAVALQASGIRPQWECGYHWHAHWRTRW